MLLTYNSLTFLHLVTSIIPNLAFCFVVSTLNSINLLYSSQADGGERAAILCQYLSSLVFLFIQCMLFTSALKFFRQAKKQKESCMSILENMEDGVLIIRPDVKSFTSYFNSQAFVILQMTRVPFFTHDM